MPQNSLHTIEYCPDWFGVTGSPAFLAREARRMFGEGCGLIQQSLFHAARVGLIETGGKTA